jgi:hypothetical protein
LTLPPRHWKRVSPFACRSKGTAVHYLHLRNEADFASDASKSLD